MQKKWLAVGVAALVAVVLDVRYARLTRPVATPPVVPSSPAVSAERPPSPSTPPLAALEHRTLARSYRGTIGTQKVLVRLAPAGATLTGRYFYADRVTNGDVLTLAGTYAGSAITLAETVNGRPTGGFALTLGDAGLTGSWKDPARRRTLPVVLEPIPPGLLIVTRRSEDRTPAENGGVLKACSLAATYLEVFGLSPDDVPEIRINRALAPPPIERTANGLCDFGISQSITQKVLFSDGHLLTVETISEYDGGAHPSVAVELTTFALKDGEAQTGKKLLAPGTQKLRALIRKHIVPDPADAGETLEEFDSRWPAEDSDDRRAFNVQMGVDATGLVVDMTNEYPHVIAALAPRVHIPWAEVKPLLAASSPVRAMAR